MSGKWRRVAGGYLPRRGPVTRPVPEPLTEHSPSASGTREKDGDRGETVLQIVLAAAIAVIAGLWAWNLAAAAFAGPPRLAAPGIIGVAVEASAVTEGSPIDVTAEYNPAAGHADESTDLIFTQTLSGTARKRPSPVVIVFLCGPIAQHPSFRTAEFKPVTWQTPSSPVQGVFSSVFGNLGECVDTKLAMGALDSGEEFRQALIVGSFGIATSDFSGTRILYAFPGIASWFMPVPLAGLKPSPMPPGSSMSIRLNRDPGDLTNMFASPQLPDAGKLAWTGRLDEKAVPNDEYRLEADSLAAMSQLQSHSFIAGALVGVSGGAFVWLVQLLGHAWYSAASVRARRESPRAKGEGADAPADQVASLGYIRNERAQIRSEGLGWPS